MKLKNQTNQENDKKTPKNSNKKNRDQIWLIKKSKGG